MSVQTNNETASLGLELRHAFSLFPTGVVAVCSLVDGKPVGIAVNSFTSVSLDPPLVGICVARTSATWPILAEGGRLGLSVLGADQGGLCRQLASRNGDRFAEAPWQATESGAVVMDGAALWLECVVHSVLEGGDHIVVLLRVTKSDVFPEVTPLVFHQSQFRELQINA